VRVCAVNAMVSFDNRSVGAASPRALEMRSQPFLPGGDHVVIALHGCPGSAYDWRYIGALLEPRCRFVRIELPGHGSTPLSACPSPQPLPIIQLVNETLNKIIADSHEKKVFLLGHSLGAQLGE
jgi:pimeloyl-ACP methyl ester carboxylesterase